MAVVDLAGVAARAAGHFDEVAPWSLIWADTLAGRISVGDLDGFTLERRERFARRISEVPVDKDLADFDESERRTVHDLCMFGYPGVWAPKSTKVSSLYRPRAVPVLDGYVAMAFGFKRSDFSEGREARWNRISRVIDAMATCLDANRDQMTDLRETVRPTVSDIDSGHRHKPAVVSLTASRDMGSSNVVGGRYLFTWWDQRDDDAADLQFVIEIVDATDGTCVPPADSAANAGKYPALMKPAGA